MFDFLRKYLKPEEFVPTPKKKVPGAMHPLVAEKMKKGRAAGVGIVYSKSGLPRIDPGWINSLDPAQKDLVAKDLSKRGFKVEDFQ